MPVPTAWNLAHSADTAAAFLATLDVAFTIGAEGGDEIDVLIKIVDGEAGAVADFAALTVWLTDAQGADSAISSGAPSAGVALASSAKGIVLIEHTADLLLFGVTDTNGELELTLGEAGVATWYMNVMLPGGGVAVSDAITFA